MAHRQALSMTWTMDCETIQDESPATGGPATLAAARQHVRLQASTVSRNGAPRCPKPTAAPALPVPGRLAYRKEDARRPRPPASLGAMARKLQRAEDQ
jgi:hypothetical protein